MCSEIKKFAYGIKKDAVIQFVIMIDINIVRKY